MNDDILIILVFAGIIHVAFIVWFIITMNKIMQNVEKILILLKHVMLDKKEK